MEDLEYIAQALRQRADAAEAGARAVVIVAVLSIVALTAVNLIFK